jgi:hypothetical protein
VTPTNSKLFQMDCSDNQMIVVPKVLTSKAIMRFCVECGQSTCIKRTNGHFTDSLLKAMYDFSLTVPTVWDEFLRAEPSLETKMILLNLTPCQPIAIREEHLILVNVILNGKDMESTVSIMVNNLHMSYDFLFFQLMQVVHESKYFLITYY